MPHKVGGESHPQLPPSNPVRRSKFSSMLKYWPQLAASVPALLLILLALVRNVLGIDVSVNCVGWLIGANVLSFATCIAFALLHPKVKAWRYAAFFNAWLFIVVLIASILRFGA